MLTVSCFTCSSSDSASFHSVLYAAPGCLPTTPLCCSHYSALRRALQDTHLRHAANTVSLADKFCHDAAIRASRAVLQIPSPVSSVSCEVRQSLGSSPRYSSLLSGPLIPLFTLPGANEGPSTPITGIDSPPCNELKLMMRCAPGCAISILVKRLWHLEIADVDRPRRCESVVLH